MISILMHAGKLKNKLSLVTELDVDTWNFVVFGILRQVLLSLLRHELVVLFYVGLVN